MKDKGLEMSQDREDFALELFNKGKKCFYEDNSFEAAQAFNVLLKDYSDICHILGLNYWLGLSYCNHDDYEQSLKHLLIVYKDLYDLKYKINNMEVLYRLGFIYYDYEQYEESLKYLDEAEQYYPFFEKENWNQELFEYRVLKGKAYFRLCETEKATNQFTKANQYITQDDDIKIKQILIYFLVARAYVYDDQADKAEDYIDKIDIKFLEIDYHCEFYFICMWYNLVNDNFENLIISYQEILLLEVPDTIGADIYNFAGKGYFHLGEFEKAKQCFQLSEQLPYNRSWLEESNIRHLKLLQNKGYI